MYKNWQTTDVIEKKKKKGGGVVGMNDLRTQHKVKEGHGGPHMFVHLQKELLIRSRGGEEKHLAAGPHFF